MRQCDHRDCDRCKGCGACGYQDAHYPRCTIHGYSIPASPPVTKSTDSYDDYEPNCFHGREEGVIRSGTKACGICKTDWSPTRTDCVCKPGYRCSWHSQIGGGPISEEQHIRADERKRLARHFEHVANLDPRITDTQSKMTLFWAASMMASWIPPDKELWPDEYERLQYPKDM